MKKIEINILLFILTEGIFLLLFFKTNLISILLGIILGISLIILTKKIKKNNITKRLLQITSIPLVILITHKTIIFISNNILKNYSLILISIPLLIISVIISQKKYHIFIKTIEIVFYLIMIIRIFSFILTISLVKVSNFGITLYIDYHFIYIGLITLYTYKCLWYLTNYQIKIKDIIISYLNPFSIKIKTMLILGNTLSSIYKYPYISSLKRIKYFDFIERIDGVLSFEYLFCFIITISFLLFNIRQLKKAN